MRHRTQHASLLVFAVLAAAAPARAVQIGNVEVTAFTSFVSQRVPLTERSDSDRAPEDQVFTAAQALVRQGLPFPNVPNSQGSGFASSTATVGGVFGVGVNGFFLQNSLPPNRYRASGTWSQTITNDEAGAIGAGLSLDIPPPRLQFFGVGNVFPTGANLDLDAFAEANLRITSKLTHPDGTVEETVHLDYGLQTVREPLTSLFLALPTQDGAGLLNRFDEPDGSFGFQLAPLSLDDVALGLVGPGDVFEYGYEYFVTANTGFGETGVFAAIGDPFDLTLNGGGISLQLTPVPEPGTLTLVALGLALCAARRRR
jgi:hypothetical protein